VVLTSTVDSLCHRLPAPDLWVSVPPIEQGSSIDYLSPLIMQYTYVYLATAYTFNFSCRRSFIFITILIFPLSLYLCFRSSQSAFYKVLIANAGTSALRLHQRLPQIQFTKEFLALLLIEDSCHYLFFSLIFLYVQPVLLVLFPVVLFAVLHSASYSLKMLDVSIPSYL
jgi:hypothetical protein